MSWHEVERSTTVAPRNLRRNRNANADAYPSVGGTVETESVTWRCLACRKLAVTSGNKPSKCCCGAAA